MGDKGVVMLVREQRCFNSDGDVISGEYSKFDRKGNIVYRKVETIETDYVHVTETDQTNNYFEGTDKVSDKHCSIRQYKLTEAGQECISWETHHVTFASDGELSKDENVYMNGDGGILHSDTTVFMPHSNIPRTSRYEYLREDGTLSSFLLYAQSIKQYHGTNNPNTYVTYCYKEDVYSKPEALVMRVYDRDLKQIVKEIDLGNEMKMECLVMPINGSRKFLRKITKKLDDSIVCDEMWDYNEDGYETRYASRHSPIIDTFETAYIDGTNFVSQIVERNTIVHPKFSWKLADGKTSYNERIVSKRMSYNLEMELYKKYPNLPLPISMVSEATYYMNEHVVSTDIQTAKITWYEEGK